MQLSFSLHKDQVRKGTEIPYYSHLLSVAALVQEAGGDEDTQIAALLHDAVEDQGGEETLQLIRDQFGDAVAEIVLFCSDSVERDADGNKLPWCERKEAHLEHLRSLERRSLTEVQRKGILVMIADKLHNARSTYENVLRKGDEAYTIFRGGKEGTLWYLKSCASLLGALSGWSPIAKRLRETVALLQDDLSATKKIIRLHGHHVDTYYDASTPLLQREALAQIFEDLKSDGCYGIIQDDAYLQKLTKELEELEELEVTLNKGAIPSILAHGVAQQVKLLPQMREEHKELTLQIELYAKATQGDKAAARELVTRRKRYNSEFWDYEVMRTSAAGD